MSTLEVTLVGAAWREPECTGSAGPAVSTAGEPTATVTATVTASADDASPWRATGLETPVFADPSGRRARAMGAVGLAILATTLAALAIVVTAAIGFVQLPTPGSAAGPTAAGPTAGRHPAGELASAHVRAVRHGHGRYVAAAGLSGSRIHAAPDGRD